MAKKFEEFTRFRAFRQAFEKQPGAQCVVIVQDAIKHRCRTPDAARHWKDKQNIPPMKKVTWGLEWD